MWQIGDKVKFIKNGKVDSRECYGLKINKTYKIIEKRISTSDNYCDNDGYDYVIEKYPGASWVIEPGSFKKVIKRKTKNEFKLLDMIQKNFKDGF